MSPGHTGNKGNRGGGGSVGSENNNMTIRRHQRGWFKGAAKTCHLNRNVVPLSVPTREEELSVGLTRNRGRGFVYVSR